MYTEVLIKIQKEWSEKAVLLMRELLPLMVPVSAFSEFDKRERQVLGELLSAAARSTESAFLLSAYGQLWDADVIMRSVCEGTLKVLYILQSRESFRRRIEEFDTDLFEISLLKNDSKARELLNSVANPDDREWKPIKDLLISPEKRAEVNKQYDRKTRQELERRWGFTGLIAGLTNSADPLFKDFTALLHEYSNASHILHADCMGIGMPMERDLRGADERDSIHLAHLSRIISDGFGYFKFRVITGYRLIDYPPADAIKAMKIFETKCSALEDEYGDVYKRWMDIQYPS